MQEVKHAKMCINNINYMLLFVIELPATTISKEAYIYSLGKRRQVMSTSKLNI